jgi:hypothetical protein
VSEIQNFSVFSNGSRTFRARFQGTGEYDDQFSIRSNVCRVTNNELMEAIAIHEPQRRLIQRAHWARAQGPQSQEGPQAVGGNFLGLH